MNDDETGGSRPSEPPPLPAEDPEEMDVSLAVSVGELLDSVSEAVGSMDSGAMVRPLEPMSAEIVLHQPDVAAARAFYEGLLGLEVLDADDEAVRCALFGVGMTLLLTSELGDGPVPTPGVTLLRLTVEDIGSAHGRVLASGRELDPPREREGGGYELPLDDPAGYRVVLVEPDS